MDSGNEPAVKRAGAGGITGVHERPLPDVAPWQRRVKFATCPRHISHDGGFTVSASSLEQVRGYVLRQEEHHRAQTFQQEYIGMLRRGLVEYKERYLW